MLNKNYLFAAIILFSANQLYSYKVKVLNDTSASFHIELLKDYSGRWVKTVLYSHDTWGADGELSFDYSISIEAQNFTSGISITGQQVINCHVLYIIKENIFGYYIVTQPYCAHIPHFIDEFYI